MISSTARRCGSVSRSDPSRGIYGCATSSVVASMISSTVTPNTAANAASARRFGGSGCWPRIYEPAVVKEMRWPASAALASISLRDRFSRFSEFRWSDSRLTLITFIDTQDYTQAYLCASQSQTSPL